MSNNTSTHRMRMYVFPCIIIINVLKQVCVMLLSESFVDASANYLLGQMNIGGFGGDFDPNADNNFIRDDF